MLRQLNDLDWNVVFEYLNRNEEETAFLIGNAVQFGITNRSNVLRCGDYIGYFEGNTLKGIIAFYNLGSCIPHYETLRAIPYFCQLMMMRRFSMLSGAERLIKPLFDSIRRYKSLRELEECSYRVNSSFKPFSFEGAEFHEVSGDSDTKELSFVRVAYLRGFGAERSIGDTRFMLTQKGEQEDFILLSVDSKLVAQACIQTFTDSTSQIGAVYTLEEERGKGYAKAVVSELCRRIIEKGKLPTLLVNKYNTPAIKAYEALGFEHRDDYLLIRLYG